MAGHARYQMRTEAAGHRELARYVAPGQHQDRGGSVPARRQRNPLGTPAEPGHGRRSRRRRHRLGPHAGYDHRAQAIDIAQAGHATLVCGTAVSQAAIRAGLPANRIATTVSGVEFRWRDVTIKSLTARHESTMTINEQFVADQPESFLLSTTADSRISCGGDVSISQDLKRGRSSQPNITVVERRRAPEFVPTIIVNDGPVTPPSAGLSATVVTLGHADCGPAPDIRFVQTSDSTVRITSGASILEVAIVAFRQEQAWTGVGVVESRPIDDYTDTVGPARAMTKGIDGTQSDDRVAAAVGILTASSADPTPLRLPLGDHAVDAVLDHLRTVEAEIRQWEPVSTPPSATKGKDWNPPRNELR